MVKKVHHLKEVDDAKFTDELNDIIADHEADGWELIDTDLSSDYDPEHNKMYCPVERKTASG